ncbi:uncharacterized protein BJ212DRAFT_998147 [Suillus subaureus]|uniref:Uncharacterized protein n=1 Tax=Suillus subaureus TaxID=48587 RepID=A0A9P7DTC5_9AGAM|nr:uncharacterized protein BJ212DRAFT_998147 [Suillus subaureus]KAG1802514.1 hypothetical protein BJ212DRAFT_998147 [Suillus subaureus]
MSLIRAATMLGFDSDRVWLVRELEALWPFNLGELFVNPEPRIDAPEVAALARTCDIDALLKPAFYDMARVPGFGLNRLDKSEQISRADVLRLVRMREYLSGTWTQVAAHEDPTFVCQTFGMRYAARDKDPQVCLKVLRRNLHFALPPPLVWLTNASLRRHDARRGFGLCTAQIFSPGIGMTHCVDWRR